MMKLPPQKHHEAYFA